MFYVLKETTALLGKRTVLHLFAFFIISTAVKLFQIIPLAMMMPLLRVIANPEKKGLPGKMSKILPENVAQQINTLLNQHDVQTIVVFLLVAVIILMVIQSIVDYYVKNALSTFINDKKIKLSNTLFQGYLQSTQFNYKDPIGKIKLGCTNLSFILETLIEVLGKLLLMLVLCFVVIYAFSLPGIVFIVTIGVVTLITNVLLLPKLQEIKHRSRVEINQANRKLKDSMLAIKEIKTMSRERHFFQRYKNNELISERQKKAHKKIKLGIKVLIPIARFGSILAGIIVALYSLPIEKLSLFLLAFLILSAKLMNILDGLIISSREINEKGQTLSLCYKTMLHYGKEALTTSSQKTILKNNIELRDISFEYNSYDDDDCEFTELEEEEEEKEKEIRTTSVFKGLNLKIKKGQYVGIVGKNGIGKSTILDLLVGLVQPSHGSILIDGIPLAEIDQKLWRKQINYVIQSPHMVSESVLYNITLGLDKEEIDHQKLDTVIRLTHLNQVVEQLPNGIDSVLGVRGTKISGGQTQRIGLARALYQDSPILLLDEATRAIDAVTESEIMSDIIASRNEKTIIIVTHRIDTLKQCDNIFVIDDKKLRAEGDYTELSKTCKLFRQFIDASQNFASSAETKTPAIGISPSVI